MYGASWKLPGLEYTTKCVNDNKGVLSWQIEMMKVKHDENRKVYVSTPAVDKCCQMLPV